MLKKRKLGNVGLKVSEIGLGCMPMSQFFYGNTNDAESIATILRAIDLGVDFFDTAELYGPYTNEKLLGQAIKDKRDTLVIATKFGFNIVNGQKIGLNSKPVHIKDVVESSLKRLNTDYIDLLYQHRVDPAIPIEEVVYVMSQLVKEGKVRYLGLSEASAKTIRRAHKVHPISALQSEFSLWERSLESEIIPTLKELKIGLVPFSPLGRGFLTGINKKAEDYEKSDVRSFCDPRLQGKNYSANMKIVEIIRKMADSKKATPAQIALAWLLHKGDDIVPIPGTKRRLYLEENIKAADVTLFAEDMQELEALIPPGAVSGARYNSENMTYIDR